MWFVYSLGSNDFNSVTQTATIVAGKSSITVNITIADDSSVEGNENFNMSLNIPSSLGPAITAGDRNRAIGVIIDTTSEDVLCYYNTTMLICVLIV